MKRSDGRTRTGRKHGSRCSGVTEMEIGSIVITYSMADDGDLITDVSVEGDIPIATQLGLLELAKDSILIGTVGDD